MTEGSAAPARTPWHLWAIGVATLLWNGVGAYDYLMTQTQNATYMGGFTPEQLEFFYGLPAWVVSAWAVAVWGGVLGSVLLLLRRKLAVPVLLASFVAMVLTAIHNFILANGLEVMGAFGAVFSAVIFAIALGLWFYSRKMRERSVLA